MCGRMNRADKLVELKHFREKMMAEVNLSNKRRKVKQQEEKIQYLFDKQKKSKLAAFAAEEALNEDLKDNDPTSHNTEQALFGSLHAHWREQIKENKYLVNTLQQEQEVLDKLKKDLKKPTVVPRGESNLPLDPTIVRSQDHEKLSIPYSEERPPSFFTKTEATKDFYVIQASDCKWLRTSNEKCTRTKLAVILIPRGVVIYKHSLNENFIHIRAEHSDAYICLTKRVFCGELTLDEYRFLFLQVALNASYQHPFLPN